MVEKINIAELLKDCPRGMELDCTMFDNVTFVSVDNKRKQFPIEIVVGGSHFKYLTKEGCYHDNTQISEAKCVIFPKGKTTWEGFKMPFKDGDIVATDSGNWIGITSGGIYGESMPTYCIIDEHDNLRIYFDEPKTWFFSRLATKEEKQKLFDAIKADGYKWNFEIKTFEKLIEPIFKAGDKISLECEDVYWDIKTIEGDWYICTNGAKIHIGEQHHYKLVPVEPNFKKGDKVRTKNGVSEPRIIKDVCDTFYTLVSTGKIDFTDQDNWELVPNKFDITTFKPFDSRVLVRDDSCYEWEADIFGRYSDGYITIGGGKWEHCIPYEGNEHLLGTTNDCDEFYKTW